jgi:hypothetical protein
VSPRLVGPGQVIPFAWLARNEYRNLWSQLVELMLLCAVAGTMRNEVTGGGGESRSMSERPPGLVLEAACQGIHLQVPRVVVDVLGQ